MTGKWTFGFYTQHVRELQRNSNHKSREATVDKVESRHEIRTPDENRQQALAEKNEGNCSQWEKKQESPPRIRHRVFTVRCQLEDTKEVDLMYKRKWKLGSGKRNHS